MARIAADVVLLPDETMTDRAIEVNKQIVREYSAEITLNRENCLPHISLAMGCIEEHRIHAIHAVLTRLARENAVGELRATGIETPTNSRGEMTSLLEIERTAELQALHERVLDAMRPFFSHDVTDAVFYDADVAESTLDWVRNYPQKAGCENFRPHLTLGYGPAKPGFSFPVVFRPARLALCHLGNHATCRKVLAAVDLQQTPG